DVAPNNLSYNTPNVFTKGIAIAPINPSVSGGAVTAYSINPALPDGLLFDTATGAISGTPTSVSALTVYTVTAFNSGGSASFDLSITVNDVAPFGLTYNASNIFSVGTTISSLMPTVSGGAVTAYSINPALPDGLLFDTTTGAISGTPTSVSALTVYTVTAFNSGGSASFDLSITVNDIAPNSLSYTTPNVFTKGIAIAPINPSVSGGTVTAYSINPALPNGLNFDATTGQISGIPLVISPTTIYTVTASNSGGLASFDLSITVNDASVFALIYASGSNTFTVGNAISILTPTVSGGAVVGFSISPALPDGLLFDTTTGAISGTPTSVSALTVYTVTAFNSGGSASFDLS
ncbi:hypothetical protein G4D82_14260, partial [Flavobacterium sp. CYK-4]|uniref:putative Ig domain-containing protein n=1 Tax=Flavobacterium lotistagni TaxID=2709660 RepID=UPI001A9C7982